MDGLGAISVEARGEGTRARVGDRRTVFAIDVPVELRPRGDRAPAPSRGSPAGHDRNETPRTPQEDQPSIRTACRASPSVSVAPVGRRGRVRLCARRGPGDRPGRRGKAAGTPEALVLFDGKTLDGWKKTDFSRPGEVKVEDGGTSSWPPAGR